MSPKPPQKQDQAARAKLSPKKANDHIAQFFTSIFGTLSFLFVFLVFIAVWTAWNLKFFPGLSPFDPFPFPRLELILSAFAIFLSIAVLISQKRQARLEKISEQVEFEVNLRAEKEITKVLEMLQRIQQKLGIEHADPELKQMMKDLDTEKLHREQKEEND
ncbi:MAG: DUF1003 domain-containing protein [Pedobacter sp.]|nr:DUF1003 domain-containing protein [Pedobacter sp.]MDQ8052246.1 DUF1003 domain-containing protein [Pedobacter sp.]